MSSGSMRERIAIRRATRVQIDDGSYTATIADAATMWAEVRPVQAAEKEQAGRLYGSTTHIVKIYANAKPAGLSVDDVVRWLTAPGGAVDFNIRAVRQEPGRALHTELICEGGAIVT